ncbi:nucleotidyl transferase AbiEii/AbiGii toxin family protein [Marinilongibacter aquaticus]|uniref:nucleotidyl transferase AbiEii/AbiGii toxin family protein n=1 Tax=Marinilongibacter aquaticus TaxID=2975157 RepID=UPI0021BDBEA2|nr:nucleotidyl transferase AbiEii/AbiGii toxin family protein [Marinilongibacter aquaticus]UBM57462.1 nucleotidyl transferase AbiEii/AbiGii toxin family protein [Marinilongibacter aquaticus]
MVNSYKNIVRLKVIGRALSELSHKIVFVGGAVVELYTDDPARGEVRPTDDIDVLIEMINRSNHALLEEKLRAIGFKNDMDSGVICRYKYHDIVVDVMPEDGKILGFTNSWYSEGLKNTSPILLDDDVEILIFNLEYFLASKFEALNSFRHGKDFRFNSDFEDIIYVFDNRLNIIEELQTKENPAIDYLRKEVRSLLERPNIEEEIISNIEPSNSALRADKIIQIMKAFVQ